MRNADGVFHTPYRNPSWGHLEMKPSRPTIVLTVLITLIFLRCNFHCEPQIVGRRGETIYRDYGWPAIYWVESRRRPDIPPIPSPGTASFNFRSDFVPLALNSGVAAIILASAVIVSEGLRRRRMSVRTLMIFVALLGLLFACFRQADYLSVSLWRPPPFFSFPGY
jgi:hypothetical protein